ncbi:MAG: hypothetical protein ACLFM0_10690 [Spirochaetales bacterium]
MKRLREYACHYRECAELRKLLGLTAEKHIIQELSSIDLREEKMYRVDGDKNVQDREAQ